MSVLFIMLPKVDYVLITSLFVCGNPAVFPYIEVMVYMKFLAAYDFFCGTTQQMHGRYPRGFTDASLCGRKFSAHARVPDMHLRNYI